VGSVKAPVVHELEPLFSSAGAHFVGSHPMAGAEKMGVMAARANLFHNAVCVVTPGEGTSPEALRTVQTLWSSLGARLLTMTPMLHDQLASRSSHLAHVLASGLASYVLDPAHGPEQAMLCANGFRDTTRVASGSPEMWRDIALTNRSLLADALRDWLEELAQFQTALANSDAESILNFFERAKDRRDHWCAQSASPSPE
jgi:prephenate dehydrogenase